MFSREVIVYIPHIVIFQISNGLTHNQPFEVGHSYITSYVLSFRSLNSSNREIRCNPGNKLLVNGALKFPFWLCINCVLNFLKTRLHKIWSSINSLFSFWINCLYAHFLNQKHFISHFLFYFYVFVHLFDTSFVPFFFYFIVPLFSIFLRRYPPLLSLIFFSLSLKYVFFYNKIIFKLQDWCDIKTIITNINNSEQFDTFLTIYCGPPRPYEPLCASSPPNWGTFP